MLGSLDRSRRRLRARRALLLLGLLAATPSAAQVHYHEDGRPWNQRASSGPDAAAGGWYYHLGLSGIEVELRPERPRHLLVRYVQEDSPAAGKVRAGDWIVGAGGARFETPHENGYGMDVFGAEGPIGDFAAALFAARDPAGKGRLALDVEREGEVRALTLAVGRDARGGEARFPLPCAETEAVRARLLEVLAAAQREDGSFGDPVANTFAPLALLASGERRYRRAVERAARFHARTTSAEDEDSLLHWRYMGAAIVLSEYRLATGAAWVTPELEEIRDLLIRGQYVDPSQIDPRARETHPDAVPRTPERAIGGWGHNPGFEGYGPICMLTAQGALAFALMHRAGLEIDRGRHDLAYEFLERGSGRNGYVWYADEAAGQDDWADMGRTGAAAIACALSPYREPRYRRRALLHAEVIAQHPESFPDTHGSPPMGMAYAALGANVLPDGYERLLAANRWWFVLARDRDGTIHYQPNRDNAGFDANARLRMSAVVAFVLSIPRRSLVLTGGEAGG